MNLAPSANRFAPAAHSGHQATATFPPNAERSPAPAAVAPARAGDGASDAELAVVVVLGYN